MARIQFQTAIGDCSISWEGSKITSFILFDKQASSASEKVPAFISSLVKKVQKHLQGDAQDFSDTPYDWDQVTSFQKLVYQAALKVPSGKAITYGALATLMGRSPNSSRAVGTALGRNPWPLLIPCHRFIGANGKMIGYSAPGGISTKKRLLEIEKASTCFE